MGTGTRAATSSPLSTEAPAAGFTVKEDSSVFMRTVFFIPRDFFALGAGTLHLKCNA